MTQPTDTKRVWVHRLVQLPSDDSPPGGPIYGERYPLTLRPPGAPDRPGDSLQRLLDSGINGVQLLLYSAADLNNLDAMLSEADSLPGFQVAPCLSMDGRTAVEVVRRYAELAARHRSAARVGDRLVIYTYGGRYSDTPTGWQAARDALGAAGVATYWVNDLATSYAVNGFQLRPEQLRPYFAPLFEASWVFDDPQLLASWPDLLAELRAAGQPFAGGAMPEYNREQTSDGSDGGYVDAGGTAAYRRFWHAALDAGLAWNNLVSWNDISEHHDLWPSSEWNWTRADLTAFFSAKLGAVPLPARLSTPQLYVTTPQKVWLGETLTRPAEALALNTGAAPVEVSVQLLDGAGQPLGDAGRAEVAAGADGAASQPVRLSAMPAGHFLRARATLSDASGRVLAQVRSSPILVYGAQEQLADVQRGRTHWLSVPAARALPDPGLSLSTDPARGPARAQVTPPAGAQVRFAEVLQNGFSVRNLYNQAPFEVAVPMPAERREDRWGLGPVSVRTPASGFYLARVIDEQERLGYSDPVYAAP